MLVVALTDSPPALRGELTRWMIEIRPHIYVGHVNARVRDQLWLKACQELAVGSVLQVWNSPTEQGFTLRSYGEPNYRPRDFEGIVLIERPAEVVPPIISSVESPPGQPPDAAR